MSEDDGEAGPRQMVQVPKWPPRYHSYLLRCWEEDGAVKSWRFMLENPHNGAKQGFSSCEDLLAFVGSELVGERET